MANQATQVIHISKESNAATVAELIVAAVRERREVEVLAVGAAAAGQMMLALANARANLSRDNIMIVFTPFFAEVEVNGLATTAVRMQLNDLRS